MDRHDSDSSSRDRVPRDPSSPPRPPLVPGLVLDRLLGRGGHGEVWAARDPATGERVAVKVGRRPDVGPDGSQDDGHDGGQDGGPDGGAPLARELAVLARLDHPHVVRLRNVVDCPDGARALVLELAEGGSLAALVAGRGRLEARETATVAVALGRTLADLHARGLTHGDLTPANVLFSADGRPMLADLGVAAVLGAGEPARWGTGGYCDPVPGPAGDPARDVYSLGAILRLCVTGSPAPPARGGPPEGSVGGPDTRSDTGADDGCDTLPDGAAALLRLAARCTAADPCGRPPADEVARAAWTAAEPRPVRLARADSGSGSGAGELTGDLTGRSGWNDPAWDGAPTTGHEVTRRIRQQGAVVTPAAPADPPAGGRLLQALRTAAGVVLVLLVAAAGAGGVAYAVQRGSRPGATAPASTPPTDAEVSRLVTALAAGRAAAFGRASVAALSTVDEAGSPAMAADVAFVRRLAGQRVRLDGLAFGVSDVVVVQRAAGSVTVTARVRTSAHRRLGAGGRAEPVPGAAPQSVRLVLVRQQGRWLVRSAVAG